MLSTPAPLPRLRSERGIMVLEDLENYDVVCRSPRAIEYRDFHIVSTGAPSGGTVALKILKTVEGYADAVDATKVNISTHRLDEAMRFAYGAVSPHTKNT
jgi:gamma-glutamyltranspeptidase/glutathione hydrolase